MKVEITRDQKSEPVYVEIHCTDITEEVSRLERYIKRYGSFIPATKDGEIVNVSTDDILYIESVDNRTFLYSSKDSYETNLKLYEFEELLKERGFVRISKSVIVNVMKADSIKPAFNGRFLCKLTNGEDVIISRKYVAGFREFISGRT